MTMPADQNEWFRCLNAGLPDDVARLKAAGYYEEAIGRIDARLAEDWTATQNGAGANPAPAGVEAQRAALLVQREILRRLPAEYIYTEQQAGEKMQARVTGLTPGEPRAPPPGWARGEKSPPPAAPEVPRLSISAAKVEITSAPATSTIKSRMVTTHSFQCGLRNRIISFILRSNPFL